MEDLSEFIKDLSKDGNLEKFKKVKSAYDDLPTYWGTFYKNHFEQLKSEGEINQSIQIKFLYHNCLFFDSFIIDNISYRFCAGFHHEFTNLFIFSKNRKEDEIKKLKEKMGNAWKFGDNCDKYGEYHRREISPFHEDDIKKIILDIINSLTHY